MGIGWVTLVQSNYMSNQFPFSMEPEIQYKVVILIAEWYTEKSSEPDHLNWVPEIPVVLNELKERVAEEKEHSTEYTKLCHLLQKLMVGVGGIANERDLEYMAKLNELEPRYISYDVGRGLRDDNRIGHVISLATPNNQHSLPPGLLRKIFDELSEKYVG